MCLESILLKRIRGRENEVCCGCTTLVGMYVICTFNWIMFVSSLVNFRRTMNMAVSFEIVVAFVRVFV